MKTFHWIDLETTGLEPEGGRILEIGIITTDESLQELGRFYSCIHCDRADIIPLMDDFVYNMHKDSGLLAAVEASKATHRLALRDLTDYLEPYFTLDTHFAGSGVHFDLRWLRYYAPEVFKLAHYRVLDISALRLAYEAQHVTGGSKSTCTHRAMQDCEDAIAEYRQFRVTKEQP